VLDHSVQDFLFLSGKAVCSSDARITDILLDIGIDKRAKDLQNRFGQSIRSEMRDP
jgi:hypothetical protein